MERHSIKKGKRKKRKKREKKQLQGFIIKGKRNTGKRDKYGEKQGRFQIKVKRRGIKREGARIETNWKDFEPKGEKSNIMENDRK